MGLQIDYNRLWSIVLISDLLPWIAFCMSAISGEHIISFESQIVLWTKLNFTARGEVCVKGSRNHLLYIKYDIMDYMMTWQHKWLAVHTLNAILKTMKQVKGFTCSVEIPAISADPLNIQHWRTWNLLLLLRSRKHTDIVFLWNKVKTAGYIANCMQYRW